jgi:hypothetical protein
MWYNIGTEREGKKKMKDLYIISAEEKDGYKLLYVTRNKIEADLAIHNFNKVIIVKYKQNLFGKLNHSEIYFTYTDRLN